MKIIKKLFVWTATTFLLLIAIVIGIYFIVYDSSEDFKADIQSAKRHVTLELFRRGYISELKPGEVRYLYQKKCYRKCHGEAAMITAVLSPAGWIQVVERMRMKENVQITGPEADAIIKFLEEKYPTQTTSFSYETRKKIHHAVWRNDVGQGDIYADVTYATPIYMKSIGADYLTKEYDLENYHVFIISFSVHEGEIEPENLDEKCLMRSSKGQISPTPPWKLRFQTADKHHYEGVVRFSKKDAAAALGANLSSFELVIDGIMGTGKRVFKWDLPIVYPPEALKEAGEAA